MRMDADGERQLETREGRKNKAYKDSRGIWTIGIGHTGEYNGIPIRSGMLLTNTQVDDLFHDDIMDFEDSVSELIKVPVNQHQFNALVSFAFNIGIHGFTGSSTLKALNAGNYSLAADDMLMWEKPPELKKRREGERAQFLTPMPKAATPTKTVKSSATPVALTTAGAVTKESTMNPIAIFTLAMGLAKDVAPMIPEIVGDVKTFVADMEKLIADLSKKDVNTTMADIEALFDDVKADIPTVLKAVKVAKTLPLS